LNADQWHHIGYTFENGGDMTLYIDGESVSSKSVSEDRVVQSLVIGREFGGRYFDGTLDDPRVYNKGLTDTEVERLYNVGAI